MRRGWTREFVGVCFLCSIGSMARFRCEGRYQSAFHAVGAGLRSPHRLWATEKRVDGLRTLYPSSAPNGNGTLVVDETHTLFYQEHGRADDAALTALFLHGGPGSGCSPNHARFFDPSRYRIVLLDQRGSGHSEPRGEAFINNTLWHMVQDCETLRHHLDIRQWDLVLGGSWGSTLALGYAQEYPDSMRSLVLRGVCLLRPPEVEWLTSRYGGAAAMNPVGWREFSRSAGVDWSSDPGNDSLYAYYDRLFGNTPETRLSAAMSWMRWEMCVSATARRQMEARQNATGLAPFRVLVWDPANGWSYRDANDGRLSSSSQHTAFADSRSIRRGIRSTTYPFGVQTEPRSLRTVTDEVPTDANATKWSNMSTADVASYVPAQAMLTCYFSTNSRYALNNVDFLDLGRMRRVRSIRCIAVQGAMDAICPPDTALDLHIAWPEMELRIPKMSGHSMYDSGITHELIQATDRMATELTDVKVR